MTMIKVLQFSPHNENCGVGKYQEQFVKEIEKASKTLEVETEFYDSSQYKTRVMSDEELAAEMTKLTQTLIDGKYQILHIQHEFGLYSKDEFAQMVAAGKAAGVKVVVTVHLSPALAFTRTPRDGVSLRSAVHVVRQRRLQGIFENRHIEAFRDCDLLITHNNGATASLIAYRVSRDKIFQMLHPVLDPADKSVRSTELSENLHRKEGDVIMSMVGYMHKFKGHEDAIRSLSYLPDNYKLAILGGMQPVSDELNIYNHLTNVILELGLKDRVYITGYVADDDYLNALIRESDVCVYPYNNAYYSQVSSGALNLAFANDKPVLAYAVDSFVEASKEFGQIVFTSAAAYYELAREIKRIDIDAQKSKVREFSTKYSWKMSAKNIAEKYHELVD